MGRYVFKLPDVGEGTAEAELVEWKVKLGDRVEEDAPLADVMTDKATVELTSPVAGVVKALHGEPGEMRAVKSALVEIETEGGAEAPSADDPPAGPPQSAEFILGPASGQSRGPTASPPGANKDAAPLPPLRGEGGPPKAVGGEVLEAHQRAPSGGGFAASQGSGRPAFATRNPELKPLASPAVRRRAHELGVELQYVPGSGPAGRIAAPDLDAYMANRGSAPAATADRRYAKREAVDEVKVIGLRRRIAQSMQESKRRIPHFAYVEEVDMTALEDLRAHLNATYKDRPKLTVLPFFAAALVKTLPAYPQINARFDDDAGVVHRHAAVHLGIATQTPGGLIVPVVRHAETLDLWAFATEVARLAEATRAGKAKGEELTGSTLTLTSLGPLGGIATTPVINYPEVAIIGPNKIVERPVVRGGAVVIRKIMNLSSSFDHRVVDGYDAAEFIQKIKALLENPAMLFIA